MIAECALELRGLRAVRDDLLVRVEHVGELESVVLLVGRSVLGVLLDGLLDQRQDVLIPTTIDQQLTDRAREQRRTEFAKRLSTATEDFDLPVRRIVERFTNVDDVEYATSDHRHDDQECRGQDHLDRQARPSFGHPVVEFMTAPIELLPFDPWTRFRPP
ncbi:MAG: hypothetical protein ACKV2T_37580 [Kofleriaceae bacterium]